MLGAIVGAWFAIGLLTSALISVTGNGPYSRSQPLQSALILLTIAFMGPVGFAVFVYGRRNRRKHAADSTPTEDRSREGLLCQMVALRRRVDPSLRRVPPPEHWPMFQLWRSPEAKILASVERHLWRLDGSGELQSKGDGDPALSASVRGALGDGRSYYCSDDALLLEVVRCACMWTRREIERAYSGRMYPPEDWWGEHVSLRDARTGNFPFQFSVGALGDLDDDQTRPGDEWRSIMDRRIASDELRTFCSDSRSWQNMGGRSGLVLIRRGRPIAHVTLAMN